MATQAGKLVALVDDPGRHDIPYADIRAAQIAAADEIFQDRIGRIRLLAHRADEAGVKRVGDAADRRIWATATRSPAPARSMPMSGGFPDERGVAIVAIIADEPGNSATQTSGRGLTPMATNELVLDCSDIDQYLGKPIDSSPMREAFSNTDIRRWAHAMHYANLLHFDPVYARESRHGRLVAPQSFPIVMDDGHGTAGACVGKIPEFALAVRRRRMVVRGRQGVRR